MSPISFESSNILLDKRSPPESSDSLDRRSNLASLSLLIPTNPLHIRDKPAIPPPSPPSAPTTAPTAASNSASLYKPGSGAIDPAQISNQAIFALFGLLGAGLVGVSIWFFFWARNGGFRWRKCDWEEYKSTVLRRRGPNGTTLSGATQTTELGGGSIVGSSTTDQETYVDEKHAGRSTKKPLKNGRRHDDDVRAYRHEKPARVGGLNRQPDGAYHDRTSTESPVTAARPYDTPPPRKTKAQRSDETPSTRKPAGREFSYSHDATFSAASDDSRRPLRASPQHQHHRHSTPRASQASPTQKPRCQVPGSYAEPLDFDSRYSASDTGAEQARHTKAYFHPIPGLSKPVDGFRRGGGRRDSLSDSEGETGTMRS